jgi:hypothetical protein
MTPPTATTRPEPSPLEVLRAGICTDSACLMSAEGSGPCRCRQCGGSGHGALRAAITRQGDQAPASNRAARRRHRKGRRG